MEVYMINEYFLEKAESLKPHLFHTEITEKGDGKPMKEGESVIFDFGNHYVGYPRIRFSSVGHHPDAPLLFIVQFAEIESEFNQNPSEYHGWISKSWIQEETVHLDVIPGVYRFERRYAFRYIKITIVSASNNYTPVIESVSADTVTSADDSATEEKNFNEADRKLDAVSLRTLRNCMQDVFEDGPKRDRRLWLGDLRLEALANYQTYRNYDLVKRCLYLFAGTTLEEGRLANNVFTAPEAECDFQTMFDYTLFFINTLWDYYCASKDEETLRELEPVCMKQYELLRECFDEQHLLDVKKAGNIFIDWNFELDKQAPGQAVYLYGLKDLVKIEEALGKNCEELKEEIRLKTEAAEKLYDAEKGFFISGENGQISWASQIWMILAGVTDKDTANDILNRLPSEENAVKMNSPYAYHHYIQALIDTGMKEEAYRAMHAYWGGMIEHGADTFWELYNPEDPYVSPYGGLIVHSFCHAWSCTPAYFLRKYYY